MQTLKFSLVNSSAGSANVKFDKGTYKLEYPCEDTKYCTPYKTRLHRGLYLIELYGASGGSASPTTSFRNADNTFISQEIVDSFHGNAKASKTPSIGGSGGYTSGILRVPQNTDFYIRIGGEGEAKAGLSTLYNTPETEDDRYRSIGGYNGGGKALAYYTSHIGAGGGATDIRAQKDSVFNRVMVAGAGGGADNEGGTFAGSDDGSGGAGGGLTAQGYFVSGVLNSTFVASQLSGFSFGQGESSRWGVSKHPSGSKANYGSSDRPGAGGGWFGGFSSQHGNAGSGGGSSFALTENATYPKDLIHVFDDAYNEIEAGYYAFKNHEYEVTNAIFIAGIRYGNGYATIKPLTNIFFISCRCRPQRQFLIFKIAHCKKGNNIK